MASVDFPLNPSDAQSFTSGGTTYTFISAKGYWDVVDPIATLADLTEVDLADLDVHDMAYPAKTVHVMTPNGTSAYRSDHNGTTDNPTLYVNAGETIAFDLTDVTASHPFQIQTTGDVAYNTGLIHVAPDGTKTTGASAQGKTSGVLYWKVPGTINGDYEYICGNHSAMKGTITIADPAAAITLTDISVGAEATASGDGAVAYNNTTGVITYTPPVLIALTDISVGAEATASGDGAVSYDNTTGVITYTPAVPAAPTSFTDITTFGTTTEVTSAAAIAALLDATVVEATSTIQGSDYAAGAGDFFGWSVSVSSDGNTAAVGEPKNDSAGTDFGACYIFVKSAGVWSEEAKITVTTNGTSPQFGFDVSLSSDGDTVLIGAPYSDTGVDNAGAAHIFTRSGTTWTEEAKIQASDLEASDQFGYSVAISDDGNTAVIGAWREDTTASDAGAAYTFTRSGTTWTQQAKLLPSVGIATDYFGEAVAISGDGETVLVGAYLANSFTDSKTDIGAVFVFTRSGTTWTEEAKFQDDTVDSSTNNFGHDVALSYDGNTALIGAPIYSAGSNLTYGAAYVFTRSGTTWTQQAKILASDPGHNDLFGNSVSLTADGNTALVGAWREGTGQTDAGAAYLFSRNGTTWTHENKIQASTPSASGYFGFSVSLSGDGRDVFVGEYTAKQATAFLLGERPGTTHDVSQNSVFSITGLAANFVANFTNVPTTNDRTTELTLVIDQGAIGVLPAVIQIEGLNQTVSWGEGAESEQPSSNASDTVNVSLVRTGGAWKVLASLERFSPAIKTLGTTTEKTAIQAGPTTVWAEELIGKSEDPQGSAYFGERVSISRDGNTAVIGAYRDTVDSVRGGSAHIFVKSLLGVWSYQSQLIPTTETLIVNDYYGYSVDISSDGNTAIIGSYAEDTNGSDSGTVFIFTRSGTTWTQEAEIQSSLPSAESANDNFGYDVSISNDGNTAAIGALRAGTISNPSLNFDYGQVFIYTRSGTTWTFQARFQSSDIAANDQFGTRLDLSGDGDTLIAGTSYDDDTATDSGAAYVFTRSGTTWSQEAKLVSGDPAANDYFSESVALSDDGDTAFIGATGDTSLTGAGYIFTRSGTTWTQQAKVEASDKATGDKLGSSVALSSDGNIGVISSQEENSSSGAAYVFTRSGTTWTEQEKLVASDAGSGDRFGWGVSLSGNGADLVVGAPRYDISGASDQGAAYFFSGPNPVLRQDISSKSLFVINSPAANFTPNFVNVPTTDDRTTSVALIINQGATGYLPTAVQIDGVAQTILWQKATTPTAATSATDIASFTLVRSAGAWSVLGSVTAFGAV